MVSLQEKCRFPVPCWKGAAGPPECGASVPWLANSRMRQVAFLEDKHPYPASLAPRRGEGQGCSIGGHPLIFILSPFQGGEESLLGISDRLRALYSLATVSRPYSLIL